MNLNSVIEMSYFDLLFGLYLLVLLLHSGLSFLEDIVVVIQVPLEKEVSDFVMSVALS